MSFILDALKKSETDRQRQNGPALFEVRVAPPRNALPLWAIGLAALLAINLVIVAWALLRRPAAPEQAAASVAMTQVGPGMPGTAGGSPMPQRAQTLPPAPVGVPVGGTAPTASLAQTAGMTQSDAGRGPAAPGQPGGVQTGYPSDPPPGTSGNEAQGGAVNRTGTSEVAADAAGAQADGGGEKPNPDDYAPAAEPPPAAPFGNRVTRSTASGVPLYQDAAANSHLPSLRLDLHVYAASPQARFVMINMHKLHEGDSLPEGVRVESITPEGAVLSQNGTKFLLPRE